MSRVAAGVVETEVQRDGLPRIEARWEGSPLVAAVTTRPLNFGRSTEAPAREIAAAQRALRGWAWPRFRLIVGATQVHGTRLFRADGIDVPEEGSGGPVSIRLDGYDGFHTATPGVLLTVGVADCVPAFLVAPERGTVALLHAGWRGVAGDILARALATLAASYGVPPGELTAWWGPAIGPCCYPVGEEVAAAIRATAAGGDVPRWLSREDGTTRVDLRAALGVQAVAAGIPAGAVGGSTRCTACDPALHSYRRARGGGGRMVAVAGLPLSLR